MIESTSNQLNESDLNYSSESNQANTTRCVVDEQFVPKVGMTFKTLEEVEKFYKDYSKLASFSTKIRSTTRKEDEIKNQLIGINFSSFVFLGLLIFDKYPKSIHYEPRTKQQP
ncbi:hypothetical protein AHAS_Ahas11G0295300 [Arachis hypogaea]